MNCATAASRTSCWPLRQARTGVVDALKGFPDAITAVFPDAMVQTCIVHLFRNSMDFVAWKSQGARDRPESDLPGRRCLPLQRRSQPSKPASGGSVILPSARAGVGHGPSSSRFSPFPTRSGGSSIPPIPSQLPAEHRLADRCPFDHRRETVAVLTGLQSRSTPTKPVYRPMSVS